MGGKIWLVSEVGKGSAFSFTIKAKRGDESHKGLLSPDVNLGNIRIMAVDDNKDILDYFMEISHEFKVHCDTAISGEEAPHKYDMIFMIIAMTANVFREDIEKCLEAGMDNHLGKPLDFNEIINKLRHYLPRNKQEE